MTDLDMNLIKLNWCLDILSKIKNIMDSPGWTDDQKLVSIEWLVKQALKAKDERD